MSYGGGFGGPTLPGTPLQRSGRYGYGPSRYIFRNTVDLYINAPIKDADRGTIANYILVASGVQCSVQPGHIMTKYTDDQESIIQYIPYEIFFGIDPGLKQYALAKWLDDLGTLHSILVRGNRNLAGRGVVFAIDGEERV